MPSNGTTVTLNQAVLQEAVSGLTATPKTLSPWLFYDERGSQLFEQITTLPEYYLTRTERGILTAHASKILAEAGRGKPLTLAELGAGTATKTGILLRAAARLQKEVLYQPIDVSPSALQEAATLEDTIPGVHVRPQVANYITEPIRLNRPGNTRILSLYIGSSIGNFSPAEARGILANLRAQLQPGDSLLLGTDLSPSATKSVATLLAAYDDAAGVTAAFNRNLLTRLNRDLDADFQLKCFAHQARWNREESRIEMHLESLVEQTVYIPAAGLRVHFSCGETIHTENSCKFTTSALRVLLEDTGFAATRTWHDQDQLFAVTLAHTS